LEKLGKVVSYGVNHFDLSVIYIGSEDIIEQESTQSAAFSIKVKLELVQSGYDVSISAPIVYGVSEGMGGSKKTLEMTLAFESVYDEDSQTITVNYLSKKSIFPEPETIRRITAAGKSMSSGAFE